MYYVYVTQSKKTDNLYVGRTNNLKRRVAEHKQGKVWTTRRMDVVDLIFYEAFAHKTDSIRRERYLKTSKGKTTLKLMLRESLKYN